MAAGFVHTVHVEGRWENTVEGEENALPGRYGSKAEAVAVGRGEAKRRQTEHVIHRDDGSIEDRNSYGDDPVRRPG